MGSYSKNANLTFVTGASITPLWRSGEVFSRFALGIPSFVSNLGVIGLQTRLYGVGGPWRDVYILAGSPAGSVKFEFSSSLSNAFVTVVFAAQEIRLTCSNPSTHSAHEFEVMFKVD